MLAQVLASSTSSCLSGAAHHRGAGTGEGADCGCDALALASSALTFLLLAPLDYAWLAVARRDLTLTTREARARPADRRPAPWRWFAPPEAAGIRQLQPAEISPPQVRALEARRATWASRRLQLVSTASRNRPREVRILKIEAVEILPRTRDRATGRRSAGSGRRRGRGRRRPKPGCGQLAVREMRGGELGAAENGVVESLFRKAASLRSQAEKSTPAPRQRSKMQPDRSSALRSRPCSAQPEKVSGPPQGEGRLDGVAIRTAVGAGTTGGSSVMSARRALGENALERAAVHGEAAGRLRDVATAELVHALDMLQRTRSADMGFSVGSACGRHWR